MHCCVPAIERCCELDINEAKKVQPKREAWLYISRLSIEYCCKEKSDCYPQGVVLEYEYSSSSVYKRRPCELRAQ